MFGNVGVVISSVGEYLEYREYPGKFSAMWRALTDNTEGIQCLWRATLMNVGSIKILQGAIIGGVQYYGNIVGGGEGLFSICGWLSREKWGAIITIGVEG